MGEDILELKNGEINKAVLISGSPKLTMLELEAVMTVSEKIKAARFPALDMSFSFTRGKLVGARAEILRALPPKSARKTDKLTGLPASGGKASGICAVEPDEREILTGKILVLKNSKNLMSYIKNKPCGIILEEGSLLSHAAILSREAKIPSIVKVQGATIRLKSGDDVTIDATLGMISLRGPRLSG
jgi:phosphohistidine swiveling domain-containing protein